MITTKIGVTSRSHIQVRLAHRLTDYLHIIGDRPLIIVCIGTDRSTGDSFGPFTGSLLRSLTPYPYIYGTLTHPIHCQNYLDETAPLYHRHTNPYIIAIDASLGAASHIGHIRIRSGGIRPAAAFDRALPPIGDLAVTGVVGKSGTHDYHTLQSARLSLVVSMASCLAGALAHALTASDIPKDIGC